MSENVFAGKMTLDNERYVAAMQKARESTARTMETMKAITLGLTGLGAAFAGFRSAEGIIEGVMKKFEEGRQLMSLSKVTTANVKDLVVLQQAFRDADVPADSLGHTILLLQKALGGVNEMGEPTSTVFTQIGLSIGELRKMDVTSQFQSIAKGISNLKTPSEQAAVAMKIFGRSGGELLGLLRDPEAFAKAAEAMGPMAGIMAKNAEQFEKVSKSMELMKIKIDSIFTGIAAGLAPALQKVLDLVNKIDFTKWGKDIGTAIQLVIGAFKDGKVGKIIKLSLIIAFKESVNFMYGAIFGLAGAIGAAIDTLPERLKAAFSMLTNSQFWKGVGELMLGGFLSMQGRLSQMFLMIAIKFQSAMQAANNEIIKGLAKAAGYLDPTGLAKKGLTLMTDNKTMDQRDQENATTWSGAYNMLGSASAAGDKMIGAGATDVAAASIPVMVAMKDSLDKIFAAFQSGFKNNKAFDIPELKQLTDTIAALRAKIQESTEKAAQSKTDSGSTAAAGSVAYKMPSSDRLAQVGLFVGHSPVAPGLSEARRTAVATERALKTLDTLVNVTKGALSKNNYETVYAN